MRVTIFLVKMQWSLSETGDLTLCHGHNWHYCSHGNFLDILPVTAVLPQVPYLSCQFTIPIPVGLGNGDSGIPALERKLFTSLSCNQQAVIRTKAGKSRRISIWRGVHIISPILFNLYMNIWWRNFRKMVFKSVKGMLTGGQNCNNFR